MSLQPMADYSNCYDPDVSMLLGSGWMERSTKGPFVSERDALILFGGLLPHQLDVWRKDKCKVLVGVSLTNHGKATIARRLRSILDTKKLHAEMAGPDNYWVHVVPRNVAPFNSYLSSSVLAQMDANEIQYELMDDDIVQTYLRFRKVKEWWRRAIRKQIKINQDSRMAHAHKEILRRERAVRHEQQRGRD